MIKAVFFDIDGTLVPFKSHSVQESTRRAIHEIRVKGVKVFICTGRPIQFIDNLEGVEYDGMVTVTGALCIDAEGHIISYKYIPRNNVESLLEDVLDIVKFLNVPNLNYLPLEEALNDDILQLIGFFREDEEVFLKKNVLKDCNPMRWHELFADVVAGNVSKSAGIDAMIDHYGIDLSETMAFGDGGNDILMLDHVAIGIAMGNAGDKVKEHADYITDDADKDGILHALQHFGLLE